MEIWRCILLVYTALLQKKITRTYSVYVYTLICMYKLFILIMMQLIYISVVGHVFNDSEWYPYDSKLHFLLSILHSSKTHKVVSYLDFFPN